MKYFLLCLLGLSLILSCDDAEIIAPATYNCQLSGQDDSDTHPDRAIFQQLVEDIGQLTVGVQVALKSTDGKTWTGAYGMADIPNKVALTPCTKTMVGSISKTFTAVLILQLQDEGFLNIEDPLNQWLDNDIIGEIANSDQVNLQHLLTHTSGIPDYLSVEQYINALNTPFLRESQEEKLRYIYGDKAEFEPGAKYSYSNTNYVLLGLVVEKARNMSLWNALDIHLFDPLGLETAEMGTHEQPIPAGTARPYRYIRNNKFEDVMHLAVSDAATGDGGIASNMQDLNLFIEALFSGQILSDQAFEQMTKLSLLEVGEGEEDFPDWPGESYGLGISLWNTPYGTAYGHTGSTSTYEAYLFYFPDKQVSLSIGYNGGAASGFYKKQLDFQDELFRLLLE